MTTPTQPVSNKFTATMTVGEECQLRDCLPGLFVWGFYPPRDSILYKPFHSRGCGGGYTVLDGGEEIIMAGNCLVRPVTLSPAPPPFPRFIFLEDEAMNPIRFTVVGTPMPQPRPRAWARKFGQQLRAGVYESGKSDGWKAAVIAQANLHRPAVPMEGPLALRLVFRMPRPKDHFGTGRNAGVLKASSPASHLCAPDVDNLAKAVMDAMTVGGWWRDDAQVVEMTVVKGWGVAGADVEIWSKA